MQSVRTAIGTTSRASLTGVLLLGMCLRGFQIFQFGFLGKVPYAPTAPQLSDRGVLGALGSGDVANGELPS
jgi:hypothetical protein